MQSNPVESLHRSNRACHPRLPRNTISYHKNISAFILLFLWHCCLWLHQRYFPLVHIDKLPGYCFGYLLGQTFPDAVVDHLMNILSRLIEVFLAKLLR